MEQMQNLTEDKPQSPVEEHEETKQKQKKQPKKHKEDKERNQIESPTEDKQKKQKLSHTEDKKKKQKQSPTEDKHKKQIESHTEDKQTKHKLIPAEDKQKKQKINPTEDEQKKQTISPTEDEQKKTPIEEDKQEKQKESLTEDKQTKKKQSPTEDKQKKQTISPTEDEKKKSPVEEDKQEKQKESLTEDKQKKRKQTPSEDKRKKRKLSPTKDKQNKRKQSPTGNKQKYQTVSHTEDKQKKTHREEKQKRIPIDDKQMKQTLSPKENKQKNSPFEEHREEKQKHSPTEDKQEKQKESLTEDKQKKQMESHTEDKQTKHNLTPGEDKQKEQMESLTDDKHKKQKQCPSGDKQKKRKQSPTEDKPKYQTSSHTEDKQTKTHTEEKQIKTPTENKQRKQTLSPKEDKQKNSHFEEDEEEKQKQSPTEDKQEKQKESLTEDKQEKQMDSHTEDKQKKQKRNPSEDKQKTIKPTEDEQKESLTEDKQKKQMESLTEDKQSKHKLSPAEDKQKKQKQSPLEDEQKKRKLSPTEDKQKKRKQSPRENKQKNQTISHTEDKQKKTHTEEKQKMIPTEEKQMKQTLSPKENIQKNSPFEDDKEDKQKQSPTEDKQNKQTINPTEDGHKKQTINPTQDEQKKSPVEEDTSKQEKQKESLTKDKQNNEIEITQTFQQKRKKKHLTEDGPKDQKQSPTEVEQIAQVATIKTKKKKRKKKSQKEDKKQDPTAEMKQQNQHPKEDEVTIKRNKKHKKHLRKTSLNQEDDIIIVNTDSCPEQSPNSDHLDNQIFNTVTFSQIDQSKFYFILSANEWSNITPIIKKYSNGRQVRRLQGKWTDMFSEKVNEIQRGCVLTFKSHNIKSCQSRKISGPYLFASAFCKGFLCGCKYEFKIENEPILKQDVIVNCEIIGIVMHTEEEVNRRNLSGLNRTQAGKEILKSTSVNKYYNNILNANIEEMREGNFTSVPTNEVLRKVVSEVVQKENLHQNIIAEVQVLKECYEKQNDPFIRDIGLDPFTVIMFSDKQMNLLSRLSGQKSLNIYLDATGSIICNIPGQKRPYLYSAVVKPNSDLPPVSVADMLSTQHTIPRIEMFLATFKRSVNLTGKQISIQKIETDYSIALIQASLHTFSCCNLKSYLHKCYEILRTGKLQEGFTIHHLCAMHMIKDFSRQLKKYDSRIKKPKKTFLLQCFAALQNCTTITEAKNVFSDLCTVSLSAALTPRVETALKRLKQKFKQTEDIEDLDDLDDGENILSELEEENLDRKTIKDASPFTPMFQKLATAMTEDIESDANTVNESNSLHCPDVIECLVDKFMSVIPLWSGFMLNINQEGCTEINTRDTNSPVENWFKFVKNDLGLKKRSRPYKVIVALKQVIDAKLTELEFPGCRKKKTTKKINRNIDLKINEEIWKKGTKKKKSLYHTTPSKRKVDRNNTEQGEENPTYPKVMKWGGKHEETYLANTCTIDNVLTILHLKYQECPQFAELVDNQNNAVYNALLTIFKLITEGNYVEAKLVWINHMGIKIKPSTNLYGDEVDYFVKYFDRMWTTYTTSVCNGDSCVNSFISTREINGITMSASGSFHTMQELVDQWITKQQPCKDNNDENSDEEELICDGIRTVKVHFIRMLPVLIIRVYEHCLYDRIDLNELLHGKEIRIGSSIYMLAGLTLYKDSHFCSVVAIEKHGYLWYDGLSGRLDQFPKDVNLWFPCHVLYCQVL